MERARKPELYADAAYAVLTRPSRECTGNTLPLRGRAAPRRASPTSTPTATCPAPSRRSTCSWTTCRRARSGSGAGESVGRADVPDVGAQGHTVARSDELPGKPDDELIEFGQVRRDPPEWGAPFVELVLLLLLGRHETPTGLHRRADAAGADPEVGRQRAYACAPRWRCSTIPWRSGPRRGDRPDGGPPVSAPRADVDVADGIDGHAGHARRRAHAGDRGRPLRSRLSRIVGSPFPGRCALLQAVASRRSVKIPR